MLTSREAEAVQYAVAHGRGMLRMWMPEEVESNELTLCVLHHKTSDLGAFTVAGGILLVSDQANGTTGFQEALMAFHGKPIRDPQHPDWRPDPLRLEWHGREVFKGEARFRG